MHSGSQQLAELMACSLIAELTANVWEVDTQDGNAGYNNGACMSVTHEPPNSAAEPTGIVTEQGWDECRDVTLRDTEGLKPCNSKLCGRLGVS